MSNQQELKIPALELKLSENCFHMNPQNPNDWFIKAERDFKLVNDFYPKANLIPDLICHHCQQAAEKYLTSLVIHHGLPLNKPYENDLEDLLNLLAPVESSINSD